MRYALSTLVILTLTSTLLVPGAARGAAAVAKIEVTTAKPMVEPGTEVVLAGRLLDAAGQLVAGPVPLGVEDGVALQSRMVPVKGDGTFEYRVRPPVSAFYLLKFICGDARTSFTLAAVSKQSGTRRIDQTVPVGPQAGDAEPMTLFRSAAGTAGRVAGEVLKFQVDLAVAEVREVLKPKSAIVYGLTIVACVATATPAAPVAGPVCGVGILVSAKQLIIDAAAARLRVMIDRIVADETERNRLNAAVDAGKVLVSILTAGEPATGLIGILDALSTALTAGEAVSRMVTGNAPDTVTYEISGTAGVVKGLEVLITASK